MRRLEFPSYSVSVRPQNGATMTDIILQSKTMLPKVIIQRSELVAQEKKRLALTTTESKDYQLLSEENHDVIGLKV